MSTQTIRITHRTYRTFTFPRIYIEIRRKDLFWSTIILIAGLAIPAMMIVGILAPSLVAGLLGFSLTFLGGILLLIRSGEVA